MRVQPCFQRPCHHVSATQFGGRHSLQSTGLQELLSEIAQLYSATTPEDIIVMAPQEGILLAMTAILHAGDVMVRYPTRVYGSPGGHLASDDCYNARWRCHGVMPDTCARVGSQRKHSVNSLSHECDETLVPFTCPPTGGCIMKCTLFFGCKCQMLTRGTPIKSHTHMHHSPENA